MKKNIKSKILLAIAGCILLHTQAFANVERAINQLRTEVLDALNGSARTSMVNQIGGLKQQLVDLFDATFKGIFTDKEIIAPSTLDKKINLYADNFYSWYTTEKYIDEFKELDFSKSNKEVGGAVSKLLSQDFGYSTKRTPEQKVGDTLMLLAQPTEGGNNDITYDDINLKNPKAYTQYGSLDSKSPTAENAPSVNDLIGISIYPDIETANKAKLFINYLLQSAPTPKGFYIPDKKKAINQLVTLYLPSPLDDSYKTETVSTKPIMPDSTPYNPFTATEPTSEYDSMVKYLKNNAQYFQKYKLKTRALTMLRGLYLETIFNLFEERKVNFDNSGKTIGNSLVQKEKEISSAGLDKKYYEDLKTKSVADVNLEMLYAINKLSYFMYKLHQDNERSSLLAAVDGLQNTTMNSQEESRYIRAINTMIENKCWNSELSDEAKKACKDPGSATMGLGIGSM